MVDSRMPDAIDSPDALVTRIRADDEAAFARIVRLHRAAMVRVAFVVAGDEDGALGAVNDAWPAAWRRIDELLDPARLEPWLCAIAADRARDLRGRNARRAARRQRRPPAEGADTRFPGAATPGAEIGAARDAELAAALADLAAADRAILALHHVAGLTPAEIGRATGLTPSAVVARRDELERRLRRLAGGDGARGRDGDAGSRDGGATRSREGDAGAQDGTTVPASDLGERLRAYADLPVAPMNIDEVARRAKVMRYDERSRLLSLLVAIVLAAVVISIPYLGGGATGFVPGAPTAAPTPGPTERVSPVPGSPSPTPTPASPPTPTPRP